MPSLDEIYRYFYGAWRLMLGKKDGLDYLDISADGFWQSFYAIIAALPPLLASWVLFAANVTHGREDFGLRFAIVSRVAFVDISAWIMPIIIIGIIAPYIGLRRQYAAYVIATNWGAALLHWCLAPLTMLQLFLPGSISVVTFITAIFFMLAIVLGYQLTHTALQKTRQYSLIFFGALLFASLILIQLLQQLMNLNFIY